MNGDVSPTPTPSVTAPRGELVSLIMPVWRPRPDWLLAAVTGALAQARCEVELVVVDDGCPEPVADLLADVADSRLRVVRTAHGGTSHARNVGFAASTGDWIRFVDCDDVLDPDGTAHLLDIARGERAIVYGATLWCDEDLRPQWKMSSDLRGSVVTECLLNRFPIMLQALLFPRWLVERVGPWDTEIAVCQDWDFLLRALELAPVRGSDRVVSRYRRHADAASAGLPLSNRSHGLADEGMRLVLDRHFERHPELRGTALEHKARAQVDLVLARSYREAYLLHLALAFPADRAGVFRELITLSRLLVRKARPRRLVRPREPA